MAAENGMHAFAFQTGEWKVRHRKLRQRLAGDTHWFEFDGTCRAWELLDGACNVDDHWLDDPNGAYVAATIRRLEPDGTWSIWWIDPRFPGLDAPMSGRFSDGTGTFYGNDQLRGRAIGVRFIWSVLTPDSIRWEQAFSADSGASWETNW